MHYFGEKMHNILFFLHKIEKNRILLLISIFPLHLYIGRENLSRAPNRYFRVLPHNIYKLHINFLLNRKENIHLLISF